MVLVNTQPIPSLGVGAASVNRLLSYSKGLIQQGNNVRILSTSIGKTREWNEYDGIPNIVK